MRFPRASIAGAIAIAACALAYTYTAAAEPFQRLHDENGVPMILTATGKSTHYQESTACLVAGAHALFGSQLKQLKQVNPTLDIALRKKETVNCVCGDNPNRNRMKVICDSETGAECRALLCEATVQAEVWAKDKRDSGRSANDSGQQSIDTGGYGQPASDPITPSRDMVRQVQTALSALSFDPGPIDGLSGRRTAAAIMRFQRDHGMVADGQITEALLTQLEAAGQQAEIVSRKEPETESLRSKVEVPAHATQRPGNTADQGNDPESAQAQEEIPLIHPDGSQRRTIFNTPRCLELRDMWFKRDHGSCWRAEELGSNRKQGSLYKWRCYCAYSRMMYTFITQCRPPTTKDLQNEIKHWRDDVLYTNDMLDLDSERCPLKPVSKNFDLFDVNKMNFRRPIP